MVVNFDGFSRFELPSFLLCNPGSKYKDDGTISNVLGYLSDTSDEECVFNFNTTSELNFRLYKSDSLYKEVKNRRMLYVEDIGFFVITSVDEGMSSDGQYKDVTASSCEIELENKKIPVIGEIDLNEAQSSGSYVENNTYTFSSLFEKVVGVCPLWSVGKVDNSLQNKRRTFEDVDTDTNVLSFLLSDMQEAYECIFEFDTTRRTINAYSQDNFVVQTDIHLTTDDFISELEISEDSDEIYTALTAFGEDDLGLQLVNPLGGNIIYNFDYYLDWMSEELQKKVKAWQAEVGEQLSSDIMPETITLTNIMAYENSGYFPATRSNCEWQTSTRHPDDGSTKAVKILPSAEGECTLTSSAHDLFASHKYYLSFQVMTETALTASFDWYWPVAEPLAARISADCEAMTWTRLSAEFTRTDFTDGSYPCRWDYNNEGESVNLWFTSCMLFDLTEAFGAGNEPSKEWMDANVMTFGDSVSVKTDANFYKLRHGYTDADGNRVEGYFELQQDLLDKQAEIDKLTNQLYYYNQLYINIATSTAEADIQEYNNKIEEYGGSTAGISPAITTSDEVAEVKDKISGYISDCNTKKSQAESELSNLQSEGGALSTNTAKIAEIVNRLKMTAYFTAEEQEELSFYIYEGTYDDEYVTVTEDMPWYDPDGVEPDRLTQIQTLYDRAQKRLTKVSAPKCEYTAEVENFVFQKEFSHWGDQLNAGCLINVELDENDVAALFLSTITINYHDKELSFTFGNRFDRLDPKALYEDVLGNITRTANSISYVKDILYPIKNGEFDAFKEALASSRSLAKDAALNATDQEIVIDDTGLLGRRSDGEGGYDPKQLKMTNRNLVFTDDGWKTCKTALGEISLPDGSGETAYGLNAELLTGNLIMTSNLKIVDSSNNPVISVDEDGVHANFNGAVTESNIKNVLNTQWDADASGWNFAANFDEYKEYIQVGLLDDGTTGVRILHSSDPNAKSFYSQFNADELAFYSVPGGGASEKNTWMTSDALNIRRARIFDELLLGCNDEAEKSDVDYGKWSIKTDEDDGLGIFWNG